MKSEVRKLNIVHVLIWVLMAAQVSPTTSNWVKTESPWFDSLTASFLFDMSGHCEPAGPGVLQGGGHAVPVGVSVPPEHNSHSLQLLGVASQQHQPPGDFYDQRRAFLPGPADLRQHGDVPSGTAAVSPRQSVPLHLWLLRGDGHVPGDRNSCAGARLADLLQQEAAGPVVHLHTGEEEEMSSLKVHWTNLETQM